MHPAKYPSLFDSCIGVIFLGTPHRGSGSFTQDSALLTAIAAASDVYQHLETGVLDAMTSKTGSLLDVADDFISLCVHGGPKVSCFFEQRSSMLGKVIGKNNIKVSARSSLPSIPLLHPCRAQCLKTLPFFFFVFLNIGS